MEDKTYTAAEIQALKDAAYKEGYEDGFQEAYHLAGKPLVSAQDDEVMDKIETSLDAFLIQLKW